MPEFANAFRHPSGSPIRELFRYLGQPGLVSFAGGYPSPSLFDADGLRDATDRAMAQAPALLQYGATDGLPSLKDALAELGTSRGVARAGGDIVVTTGSQQAFDLLVRVLIDPGDVAIVESPCYPATLQALKLAGARIVEAPVDEDGLDVDRLEEWLRSQGGGATAKLLYTVPNYSNPSGTRLTAPRRQRLVELAARHGFCIAEDDPYGELSFTDRREPSVFHYGDRLQRNDNPVVYLSSLSKTVAPALRVGWMVAPAAIAQRCIIAKQTADLCTSPVAQAIAAAYLESGRYPAAVQAASREYGRRLAALAAGLREHLGGALDFVEPEGGMFLWAAVHGQADMAALFQAAVQANVLYVPGAAFYTDAPGMPAMRLSFAAPDVDRIAEGVVRLRQAFDRIRQT